eukprot:1244132-Pyramimonas_sp.AAC.1
MITRTTTSAHGTACVSRTAARPGEWDLKDYLVELKGYDAELKGYDAELKGCRVELKGYDAELKGYR